MTDNSVQYSLRNHQVLGVEYLSASESFALFCEQGTGKTLMMLTRIKELLTDNPTFACLIVAPKAVLGAWSRDIAKFFPACSVFNRCTIINYDILHKVLSNTYDIIVLDESHYIKNRATKRAKACHKLSLKAKYRYIMTGTPINNGKLHEYWSQMAFLFPKVIRGKVIAEPWGSFTQFSKDYCYLDQWFQPYKYKRVNEIQDVVSDNSYRVLKKDCLELPPKLPDEIWEIEMTAEQKKLYKQMAKDSVFKDYGIIADNPLTKMLKLRQLSSGYLVDKHGISLPIPNRKEEELKELMQNWDKKLVIFAEYKNSMLNILSLLRKLKIKTVYLNGESKDKNIWKEFQNDESIRVIVCQYQSASMGIDLYAADTILYYEPTNSTNLLEQSRDRIHRIGTTQPCSYLHFITSGTIEKALKNQLDQFSDFTEKHFTEYMEEYQRVFRK